MCTQATYDLCTSEHDCTSGLCEEFTAEGFTICTQSCDTANPCPVDSSGQPGTCNMQGICKPAAPNTCHL